MCSPHSAFPRIFVSFFFFLIKGLDQMPEPQTTIPILAKKIKIQDISVYSEEVGRIEGESHSQLIPPLLFLPPPRT